MIMPQASEDTKEVSKHENGSFILHEKAPYYYWEGEGQLSIKTFRGGQAFYSVGKGYYAVDDTSYLVLNDRQPYSITIEAEREIESFCIFFQPGFAEEVYHSLATSHEQLLDELAATGVGPVHFFERTYQHDERLSPALAQLRMYAGSDTLHIHEQLHEIMQRLLHVHFAACKEVATLPALRASTREELYRRLYRARDYAIALYDRPLSLNELAAVASLSPNHFLRTFKQVFHLTPHQFLINKRLERAQQLLLASELSVTDICFALGFESLGSFSWLFRKRSGMSPSDFRRKKVIFEKS